MGDRENQTRYRIAIQNHQRSEGAGYVQPVRRRRQQPTRGWPEQPTLPAGQEGLTTGGVKRPTAFRAAGLRQAAKRVPATGAKALLARTGRVDHESIILPAGQACEGPARRMHRRIHRPIQLILPPSSLILVALTNLDSTATPWPIQPVPPRSGDPRLSKSACQYGLS